MTSTAGLAPGNLSRPVPLGFGLPIYTTSWGSGQWLVLEGRIKRVFFFNLLSISFIF